MPVACRRGCGLDAGRRAARRVDARCRRARGRCPCSGCRHRPPPAARPAARSRCSACPRSTRCRRCSLSGDGFQPSDRPGRGVAADHHRWRRYPGRARCSGHPARCAGHAYTLIVEDSRRLRGVRAEGWSRGPVGAARRVRGAGPLVAVELGLDEAGARAALHQGAEGGAFASADGTLQLGELTAAARPSPTGRAGVGKGGVDAASGGAIGYSVNGVGPDMSARRSRPTARVCRCWSSQNLADAATGGSLGLSFGGRTVPAQVVGVADRFPTIAGDSFVMADESWYVGPRLGRSPARAGLRSCGYDARPQQLGRPPARAGAAALRRARVRLVRRDARPAAHRPAGPRHPGRAAAGARAGARARPGRPAAVGRQRRARRAAAAVRPQGPGVAPATCAPSCGCGRRWSAAPA